MFFIPHPETEPKEILIIRLTQRNADQNKVNESFEEF